MSAIDRQDKIEVSDLYVLEAEAKGETYGIFFPDCDLSVFEEISGLTAK